MEKFHKFIKTSKAWFSKKLSLYLSIKKNYKIGDYIFVTHRGSYTASQNVGKVLRITRVEKKGEYVVTDYKNSHDEPCFGIHMSEFRKATKQEITKQIQHVKTFESEVAQLPSTIDEKIYINHKLFQ
jgi:hypothetical protein